MARINEEYMSTFKRYQIELTEPANYKKHLETLLKERLPNIQFVKSMRRNEPEKLVLTLAVTKPVEQKLWWIIAVLSNS